MKLRPTMRKKRKLRPTMRKIMSHCEKEQENKRKMKRSPRRRKERHLDLKSINVNVLASLHIC
jgi:uncharacterized membrane protein